MKPLWKIDTNLPLVSPFEPGAKHDVVIIGAGLTGLTTAVMLTRTGLDVAVLEAGQIAELATGGNTGKLSLLQEKRLAEIRRHHPAALVRAYVDANREGMDWLTARAEPCTHRASRPTAHV